MNCGFGDVVVASPTIKHPASVSEAVDDSTVEKLIAKQSIKQFDVAALARASRLR